MPKISPTEFYAVPLRVHTFLADIPLHDVWAVDLPALCGGITLAEFLRRNHQGSNRGSRALPIPVLSWAHFSTGGGAAGCHGSLVCKSPYVRGSRLFSCPGWNTGRTVPRCLSLRKRAIA